MQQVSQYIKGERDYIKIQGDTGPLVYPAAHVYIYRLLYGWTDKGRDIAFAQYIFGVLYLLSLAVVMACYRMAKVPPYVFPMLILSKRLHSIFVLRCFNDCFAIFFLFLAIYCFQKRQFTLGSLIYSLGLGVKMSLLLALPAIACVLYQAVGPDAALKRAALMGQLQVCGVVRAEHAVLTALIACRSFWPGHSPWSAQKDICHEHSNSHGNSSTNGQSTGDLYEKTCFFLESFHWHYWQLTHP